MTALPRIPRLKRSADEQREKTKRDARRRREEIIHVSVGQEVTFLTPAKDALLTAAQRLVTETATVTEEGHLRLANGTILPLPSNMKVRR
jgi:hypothetical protein